MGSTPRSSSFQCPGVLQVFTRQGNMYASWPSTPPALPLPPVANGTNSWPAGVVAAGTINVERGQQRYACRIGSDDGHSPCACGSANPCVLPAPCHGQLCDVSPQALVPDTTYVVRYRRRSTTPACPWHSCLSSASVTAGVSAPGWWRRCQWADGNAVTSDNHAAKAVASLVKQHCD